MSRLHMGAYLVENGKRHPGDLVIFWVLGDDKLTVPLSKWFENPSTREYCDPTLGDTHREAQTFVDGTCYYTSVLNVTEIELEKDPKGSTRCFGSIAPVILMTYDISSHDSFDRLEKLYNLIPLPENGIMRVRLDWFANMDRRPVVLIGCNRQNGWPGEVTKEEVERFVGDHPGCTFAGECIPDHKSPFKGNVEGVLQVATEIFHEIYKRAWKEDRSNTANIVKYIPNGTEEYIKKPKPQDHKQNLGGDVEFAVIQGDRNMMLPLSKWFDTGNQGSYDPTRQDTYRPRQMYVRGYCYNVLVEETNPKRNPLFWGTISPVVILTYDSSSHESFKLLDSFYNQVPVPKNGIVQVSRCRDLYVLLDRHPIVIIGCNPFIKDVRVVPDEEVENFMKDHPGCTFAGECVPHANYKGDNVENVLKVALEIHHSIMKRARRKLFLFDDEIEEVPNNKPESPSKVLSEDRKMKKMKKKLKSCTLL